MQSKGNSLVGTVLDQRYRLEEIIGSGTLATVYRAEDLERKYCVAVKVLTGAAADNKSRERFRHGAQVASNLAHPNIVRLYAFNVAADGARYCVMDCVKGKNLHDLLKEKASLTEAECILVFGQVCDALEHAHAKGVVHRNLKPSNIMLIPGPGNSYVVKIADFGLAKAIGEKETRQNLARKGEFVGNVLYMSPEQCGGGKIDGRSDIYAAACLLYQCLVGQPAYTGGNSFEVMTAHINSPPAQLPDSLELKNKHQFNAILQRGLANKPEERYQLAGEMSHDLSLISEVPQAEWDKRAVCMQPVSAGTLQITQQELSTAGSAAYRAVFFACAGIVALLAAATVLLVAIALTDADIQPLLRYKIAVQEIIFPPSDARLIRNLNLMTEYFKKEGRYADAYRYKEKMMRAQKLPSNPQ